MRVTVLSVTGKQPAWLVEAIDEYAKRLKPRMKVDFIDLKAEARSTGKTTETILKTEATRIAERLPPPCRWIALDERGRLPTTQELSATIADWRRSGDHIALLIGGPDGLDASIKQRAESIWALSKLTLPHGLAKLLLVEQLYRACSLLEGHPYHRE
jgi:23S rRNA (pseudouridine1915-N3)-methyltransferase